MNFKNFNNFDLESFNETIRKLFERARRDKQAAVFAGKMRAKKVYFTTRGEYEYIYELMPVLAGRGWVLAQPITPEPRLQAESQIYLLVMERTADN